MTSATPIRVVFDTSVLVAAARSRRSASFALLRSIPSPGFQLCLSVSLYNEWQEVLTCPEHLRPAQPRKMHSVFCATWPVNPTCRKSIFCGVPFCQTPMMTWFWSWLLRLVATILSRIT